MPRGTVGTECGETPNCGGERGRDINREGVIAILFKNPIIFSLALALIYFILNVLFSGLSITAQRHVFGCFLNIPPTLLHVAVADAPFRLVFSFCLHEKVNEMAGCIPNIRTIIVLVRRMADHLTSEDKLVWMRRDEKHFNHISTQSYR